MTHGYKTDVITTWAQEYLVKLLLVYTVHLQILALNVTALKMCLVSQLFWNRGKNELFCAINHFEYFQVKTSRWQCCERNMRRFFQWGREVHRKSWFIWSLLWRFYFWCIQGLDPCWYGGQMTRHQAEVALREMNKVRPGLSQSHFSFFWSKDNHI